MATRLRGFGKERYPRMKLGVSGVALAALALGWLGFGRTHGDLAEIPPPVPLTPTAAAATTVTTRLQPTATPTATARAADSTGPIPTPAVRPTRTRTSRGS
jgi:hypothetical protein